MTQAPASGADDRRMTDDEIIESIGGYEYGWHDSDDYSKDVPTGINEEIVRFISEVKDEPQWMRERRLKALELFERKPMPAWGPDLSHVDFDSFKYYVRPTDRQVNDWEDLPEEIRDTYDRLGIPEAEKSRLVSGVAAQYESEVVYQQIQEDLERQGVIFTDTDTGLREYPEIFEEYFGKCVPRRQQVLRAEHRRLVRRFLRLRPQGRSRDDPAAGVLPHQHVGNGAVRAHADHC